ncbi:MAG: hypothetical protein ACOZAN_01870 [Patescibacteria group bacterium]
MLIKIIRLSSVALLLVFLLGLVVAVSETKAKLANRNALRTQHLKEIAEFFQSFQQKNLLYLPDNITAGNYQIGTATDGCQINSETCHVIHPRCLNLNYINSDVRDDVPSDVSTGNREKTGYMITITENSQITLTACGSEGDQKISQVIGNLPSIEIDKVATSSLVLIDKKEN